MEITAIITSLLTLLAGIGVFLIACQMMSSNLEAASSEKLKKLFSKASGSKLLGVGIGALGTAAIQSSGATTVMTIGFVNAGIISLAQAATIIYGANIGTTVTAQIVALGMFGGNSVSTSVIFSAFAGLGAFLGVFAKKSSVKTLGGILAGFGLLFVGLELMSGSMEDFAALEGVRTFLAGIISLAQAATIIYGANIGTTVTAQIVALGMFGGNSLSTSVIFSAFAGLGAFLSIFAKKSGSKTLGGILAGFGLLFVGLELMSGSMEQFAALDGVKSFLAGIGNPILLVLLGAVFTAIIQAFCRP